MTPYDRLAAQKMHPEPSVRRRAYLRGMGEVLVKLVLLLGCAAMGCCLFAGSPR